MTAPRAPWAPVGKRRLLSCAFAMIFVAAMSPMTAAAQDVVLPGSDPAIEGIDWSVEGLGGTTLRLDDGIALVADGCGTASVAYTLEPDIVGLRFDASSESSLCIDAADAVDRLAQVDGYEILVDGVSLVDAGARPVLELTALERGDIPSGTWVATGFDDLASGVLVTPLTDAELTVTFGRDGALDGTSGCGEYIGAYGFEGDAVDIGVRTTGVSECGDELRDEEFAFTTALQAATVWAGSDTGIDLLDADGITRVRLVQATSDGPAGEWVVVRFVGANGVADEPIEGSEMTIRFGADGRLDGSNGCRLFEGDYLVEGDTLAIGEVAPVGRQCRRPLRRQERRFFAGLDAAVSWFRDGAEAELRDGAGNPVVELVATDVS